MAYIVLSDWLCFGYPLWLVNLKRLLRNCQCHVFENEPSEMLRLSMHSAVWRCSFTRVTASEDNKMTHRSKRSKFFKILQKIQIKYQKGWFVSRVVYFFVCSLMSGCCSSAVFGWDCPQHVKLEIPLLWSELLSLFKSRQNKYIQWEAPKSNGAILC